MDARPPDPAPPDLQEVWGRYRALMKDPEGGAAWHAWLDEEALVVVGGEAVRRAALTPERLAGAHRHAVLGLGPQGGFPWHHEPLASPSWTPEAGGRVGMAWWALPPPETAPQPGAIPWPERLELGLGLRWDGQAWRVAFALLAGVVGPGASWAACRTAAWAEYPYLPGQNERCSRDWPEVAFRHRHRPGTPALRFLEGARFGCHFTGTCCRQTWDITAPAEAQVLLDALPWEEVAPELAGIQLPAREDGMLLVKAQGKDCQFLNEGGQCRLHLRFGHPIFAACTVFPFRFAKTPDGVDVVASSHCKSARDHVGPLLEERQVEIYQRLAMSPVLVAQQGHRLGPGQEVEWSTYREAEGEVLAALLEPGVNDWQALRQALAIAKAWAEDGASPGQLHLAPAEPLSPMEEISRLSYLSFFLNAVAVKHPELAAARDHLPAQGSRLSPKDQAMAMRWVHQLIFSKELTFAFDLHSAVAIVVILHHFLVALRSATQVEHLSEAQWTLLGTMASHGTIGQRLQVAFQELPFLRAELPVLAELSLRHLEAGGP